MEHEPPQRARLPLPQHPVMPDTTSKFAIDNGLSLPTCLRLDEIWAHIHRYLHEQEVDLKRY